MESKPLTIELAEPLLRLLKPKRVKIAVGGRAGAKSWGIADVFLKLIDEGNRTCCAREFQNSIEDSVYALLKSRVEHYGLQGYDDTNNRLKSPAGGEAFFRGLARNIGSIRSLFGVKFLWIEEGQYLSEKSLDDLMPTIREGGSEVWITMNRGKSTDPISKRFLKQAERDLARQGWYEDDYMVIVQIDWWENPWFTEELDQERRRDKEMMSAAKYAHIWEGAYSDTVEDAIIDPAWFDACIDAHVKLGFKPVGMRVVTHDPSDTGEDNKALADRHGAIFLDVKSKADGDIDEGVDWATDYAINARADLFTWDADGMGAGIKRTVANNLEGKKITMDMFNGGAGVDDPDKEYEPVNEKVENRKTNRETFTNKRAQYWWMLRDRILKTYLAVSKNQAAMFHHDELISFSSTIEELDVLRAEICSVPRKPNGAGRIQLMTKDEMRAKDIHSPNMGDCCMMSMAAKKPEASFSIPNDSYW